MWSSSSINGYTNWKDAINNFHQHERSKFHAESVFKMVTVPKTMKDLGECLSSQHVLKDDMKILKISQNITFLAYLGLPLEEMAMKMIQVTFSY